MSRVSILYFRNNELGPCKIQDEIFENLKRDFDDKIEFRKIDVDKENSENYNIEEVPTIFVLLDEKVEEKFKGLTQELFLRRAIDKTVSKFI